MTRTVREYLLPRAAAEDCRSSLAAWLRGYGFRIITLAADGITKQYPAPEALLPGNPGRAIVNIAANRGDLIGINTTYAPRAPGWPLVAVFSVNPGSGAAAGGTRITAGFFFPTFAGVSSLGVKEWEVTSSMWGVGGVIRVKAWPMVQLFDRDFGKGSLPHTPLASGPVEREPELELLQAQRAAGVPMVGATSPVATAAEVKRTSRLQTVSILAQVAAYVHTFFALLILLPIAGASAIVVFESFHGGLPLLFYVVSAGFVGGTVLLAYSIYVANRKVFKPLRNGETQGVALRALALGIGALTMGTLLGIALSPIALVWAIAGPLFLGVFFLTRRIDAPGASPPA